jgi:hypothetical protein
MARSGKMAMVVMAVADRIGYLIRCKGMELNAEDII